MTVTKLRDLRPRWISARFDEHARDWPGTIGIEFDCPGCRQHRIWAPFEGRYHGPGPKWTLGGGSTSYDTLTFVDAPTGTRSIRVLSGCRSHFNVTNGEIDFYGDSGHIKFNQENPMTDETPVAGPPATDAPATEPTPALTETQVQKFIRAIEAPLGYAATHFLRFFDGILHQRHDSPHDSTQVWAPVPADGGPTESEQPKTDATI